MSIHWKLIRLKEMIKVKIPVSIVLYLLLTPSNTVRNINKILEEFLFIRNLQYQFFDYKITLMNSVLAHPDIGYLYQINWF